MFTVVKACKFFPLQQPASYNESKPHVLLQEYRVEWIDG